MTSPTLLTLPLELRHVIYSFFIHPQPISHPIPSVGITSVSHYPPPLSLLLVNSQITSEVRDYFYATATWKLIFSHAFNFFRVDPDLRGLEHWPGLRRLRKVEVVFYCDILLFDPWDGGSRFSGHNSSSRPSGKKRIEEEVGRKAKRAVDVLLRADDLRLVIVSWIDTTALPLAEWEGGHAAMLDPLSRLVAKADFKVGSVIMGRGTAAEVDGGRTAFASILHSVLFADGGETRPSRLLLDGTAENGSERAGGSHSSSHEQPAQLRLLAFDSRQDRRLHATMVQSASPQSRCNSVQCKAFTGTAGWDIAEPT
ncbi:uncharacterized protein LTR77_007018 [Saxophila tyrrhenica]|uniref:Uncharacterized protein n=1 Tax=Saxophila tyrrhenica TaxID=1690608 RepID=A0AAV9P9C5_9PEZI|nr:hypothetical protein LTR77_007018 [Saxophila tyrrhenica]